MSAPVLPLVRTTATAALLVHFSLFPVQQFPINRKPPAQPGVSGRRQIPSRLVDGFLCGLMPLHVAFFCLRGPLKAELCGEVEEQPGSPRGLPLGVERSERAFALRAKMSGANFAPASRQIGLEVGDYPPHPLHLSFFETRGTAGSFSMTTRCHAATLP